MHSKMNTKISPRVTHQKLMDLFRYSLIDKLDLQENSSFMHHSSIILLHHFQAVTTPFLHHFCNKQREIITTYVKQQLRKPPLPPAEIRCSVQVVRGCLVDVIRLLVYTPSTLQKPSKINGFQSLALHQFQLLHHFYSTKSAAKLNDFLIAR